MTLNLPKPPVSSYSKRADQLAILAIFCINARLGPMSAWEFRGPLKLSRAALLLFIGTQRRGSNQEAIGY